jgi:hypothetical protein
MSQVVTAQSPARLRNLSMIELITCRQSDSRLLCNAHKESLVEDMLIKARRAESRIEFGLHSGFVQSSTAYFRRQAHAAGWQRRQAIRPSYLLPSTSMID